MSKRLNQSGGGGTPNNTLFKYFAKSPAAVEKKKIAKTQNGDAKAATSNGTKTKKDKQQTNGNNEQMDVDNPQVKPVKRSLNDDLKEDTMMDVDQLDAKKEKLMKEEENQEEEEDVVVMKRKRRRIVLQESEDEDHNDSAADKDFDASSDDETYDGTNSDSEVDSDEENTKRHNVNAKKSKNKNEPKTKKPKKEMISSSLSQKLQTLQHSAGDTKASNKNDSKYEKIVCTNSTLDEPVVWPHNKIDFIKPDKIKDKRGRRPDHPDYDASTLMVPTSFLDSLSPGVRQWWVLKSDNWDCVLFFKVGKFYELYHMDADVGVNELGFTYMRGEFAHSGFPEVSFDKMASILVDRGYKVARVEQTETPDMMTERCKLIKATKFDKVVRREICQITNRGTQVFGSQCQITANYQPNYMLAVTEKNEGITSRYGVCYIDTSIGDFFVGEFNDDKSSSRLLTLFSHHMPVLIITEKNSLTPRTQQILRTVLCNVLKETLPAVTGQLCSAEKTLKHLAEKYFASASLDNWPLVIRCMQSESDHLGLTPDDNYKLALKALGACIAYMQKCHLEQKVLPMARYNMYVPPDMLNDADVTIKSATSTQTCAPQARMRAHMVLDSITLSNLRITGEEHSLLSTLDNCCTKFGKRLLHHWVCSPSCDLNEIVARQEAITDLIKYADVLQEARALLAPMPDFERHLAQIHLFGNKNVVENHPDGRAIMFEEKQYNKKKIQNFIAILKGFEVLTKIPEIFKSCQSSLIKRITQTSDDGGQFPTLEKLLEFFKNAFDHEEAAKTGAIAPEKGVDVDYDAIENKIAEINQELNQYLVEQEKFFGCRVVYFGADKKRYQLEVPESATRKAGKEYSIEGQKKGNKPVRRYTTNETRQFLKQMQNAEIERNTVLKDLSRRIFEKFSNHYETWKQCINCVATLDVLASLAEYARTQQLVCVPELSSAQEQPFVDIAEGYHPCVSAETYIPNGLVLGTAGTAPLSILTGPNMGGKSTLMRQVGLLVIMAQIGSHVPAQHCKLSIVDRIFTRLGAQDDILSGQSTFLVELNETSLILKHATRNSLVLLDELGRGTATYDGTAIAASVVNYLADLKCRTLFSTHYHNLIDFFQRDTRITLGHMACMVENEDNEDPTQETVTFLYKYSSGACPKSYGFNAAKLAGMPQPIIKRAYELSKRVEAIALRRKIAAKIVASIATGKTTAAGLTTLKNLMIQLKSCQVN